MIAAILHKDYTTPSIDNVTGAVSAVTTLDSIVTYDYDKIGRRTGMTSDTLSLTYGYNNARGLLDTITFSESTNSVTGQFDIGYDTVGRASTLTYPNDVVASFTYDSTTGSLTDIKHTKTSTDLEAIAYTYNKVGFVQSMDRAGDSSAGACLWLI